MGFHPSELCQRAALLVGDPHCGEHPSYNMDCSTCTGKLWSEIEGRLRVFRAGSKQ